MNKSESNETNRTPQNLAPKNKYVISSKLSVQLHALQWGKYWNLDMQSELKLYEFDVAKKMFSALNTLILKTKACVRYFLSNFYFFTKWYPFKNYEKFFFCFMKKALFVLEIIRCLYFCPSLFFSLSAIALKYDRR